MPQNERVLGEVVLTHPAMPRQYILFKVVVEEDIHPAGQTRLSLQQVPLHNLSKDGHNQPIVVDLAFEENPPRVEVTIFGPHEMSVTTVGMALWFPEEPLEETLTEPPPHTPGSSAAPPD